jgi:hypothetical protein
MFPPVKMDLRRTVLMEVRMSAAIHTLDFYLQCTTTEEASGSYFETWRRTSSKRGGESIPIETAKTRKKEKRSQQLAYYCFRLLL